jgi:2-amino-4-hydroxy-6-hydroxymethyldihydropteridine diphosphokinase/dihydropteroate synthase
MVILGLGSNVGARLDILRSALEWIKKISSFTVQQVSPVYISDALLPDAAPASWDKPYLNLALRCATTLTPEALLEKIKEIEVILGRKPHQTWAPRPVDIDILAWDDWVQYDKKLHIPHEHLHTRPFALWPLADVAPRWVYPLKNQFHQKTAAEIATQWGSRFSGDAPLHTRQIAQRIDTPRLVGILNITPDSFSDANLALQADAALLKAQELVMSGADILDIGAEATGPGAQAITSTQEWQRLEPVLTAIFSQKSSLLIPPKISVDTRRPDIAKKVLQLGADWINDVSGLSHPDMRALIANHHCAVVIMHELGIPSDQTKILPLKENPLSDVYNWAEKTLQTLSNAGIARERVIVDIGLGFGKNAAQSLELLQQISAFKTLNTRLMIGHSRKSFLQQFTLKPAVERDVETLPISLYLANQDVDYLRLHNIDMCARAFKVAKALNY